MPAHTVLSLACVAAVGMLSVADAATVSSTTSVSASVAATTAAATTVKATTVAPTTKLATSAAATTIKVTTAAATTTPKPTTNGPTPHITQQATASGVTTTYAPANNTASVASFGTLSSGTYNDNPVQCASGYSNLGGVCYEVTVSYTGGSNTHFSFKPAAVNDINYVILHLEDSNKNALNVQMGKAASDWTYDYTLATGTYFKYSFGFQPAGTPGEDETVECVNSVGSTGTPTCAAATGVGMTPAPHHCCTHHA